MALTLRGDGTGTAFQVNSGWWNDYFNLLTGVMTDQSVSLNYRHGSANGIPTLVLKGDGFNLLLKGMKSDNTTQAFAVDSNGNLTLAGNVTPSGTIFPKTTTPSSNAAVQGIDFGNATMIGVFGSAAVDLQLLSNGNIVHSGSLNVLKGTGANIVQFQNSTGTQKGIVDSSGNLTLSGAITTTGLTIGGNSVVTSGSGGTPRIFTGTSTPTGAVDGDIWIKA